MGLAQRIRGSPQQAQEAVGVTQNTEHVSCWGTAGLAFSSLPASASAHSWIAEQVME